MKSIILKSSLVIVIILLFTNCNKKNVDIDQLSGYWVLKSIDGVQSSDTFKLSNPTLIFDVNSKTIQGCDGCNKYNASFALNGIDISFSDIALTQLLCEQVEKTAFSSKLENSYEVILLNDTLTLSKEGIAVLKFEKTNAPVIDILALVGTWNVKSLEGKEVGSAFTGVVPTITFDFAHSVINGNAGCNNYNAQFLLDQTKFVISSVISTELICPNSEAESLFLRTILDTSKLTLKNNLLSISKKDKVVLELQKQ